MRPLREQRSAVLALQRLLRHLASEAFGRRRQPLLFLHGPPGSGKSHLVAALLGHLSRVDSPRSVNVVAAAEVGQALQKPPLESREQVQQWREVELLIVEDLQFFAPSVVENLAYLLDDRQGHGRATVCGAACGPAELPFPAKLTSRLAAGVVVHVEPLAVPSRVELVEYLIGERGLAVTPEVVAWAARQSASARELAGLVSRFEALAAWYPPPLAMSAVEAELQREDRQARDDAPEAILAGVARHYGVTARQLRGRARQRAVLWPRHVAIYLLRDLLGLPLARIGTLLGNRDHTTIMHAIEKVKVAMGQDAGTAQEIRKLRAVLQ